VNEDDTHVCDEKTFIDAANPPKQWSKKKLKI